jgi:hypothetical protein
VSTVKRGHYVPQAYLRNFVSEDGQLWVFDKPNQKSYPTNTRNAAVEARFYDVEKSVSDVMEQAIRDEA